MKFGAVLLIYNLLMPLAFLVTIPGYLVKMFRRGNYGRNFWQRFGIYSAETRQALFTTPPIWIHAVSVGEVFVALKLIRALKQSDPDQPIVLSCTTSTGYQQAVQKCSGEYVPIYNPLDFPLCVQAAFRAVRPRLVVLVEQEMWPNFLWQAQQEGTPVLLVNARLSPRSERRFQKFQLLTRPMFQQLSALLVPTEADVDRWHSLGVPRELITVSGNIKYDEDGQSPNQEQVESFRGILDTLRGDQRGPVLLAGSTHSGEELWLGKQFLELRENHPDSFLIIVPRHWERGASVARELSGIGLSPILRTDVDSSAPNPHPPTPSNPSLIVNTTGELRAWYELADIVLIGKSFLAEGGQNPVEPILAGKAVVMGPKMQNFAEPMRLLLAAEGCRQLNVKEELVPTLKELLSDESARQSMAARGQEVVARDQGAARRTAEFIRAWSGE